MKLEELIKQDRFADGSQRAMLNILVTSSWVTSQLSATMSRFGLTPAQYNVLRILRGSHPGRMTCSDIGSRLLDRTPDVTRLLNRLESAGHIERNRSTSDRRVVEVGITQEGLNLLTAMDPETTSIQDRLSRHLTEDELHRLSDLLERYRSDQID
ncbi:MAG: MarR family transcriptional regulator [Rhodothermales bacterium]|nr:MarR family transcriptional regulator [Rhodothermales bacterium]MBO6778905.1 MarR family transcriptional regulator [Rhodothermales bacterium]